MAKLRRCDMFPWHSHSGTVNKSTLRINDYDGRVNDLVWTGQVNVVHQAGEEMASPSKHRLLMIAILIGPCIVGVAAIRNPRFLKATVHFVSTSTSVHGLGTQQDVYLAEMTLHGSEEAVIAKLIDEYPPYHLSLSYEVLTSRAGTILKVRRDVTCDVALSLMPIRTASGDPMAILPERLGFNPQLPDSVKANDILPCYRIVR